LTRGGDQPSSLKKLKTHVWKLALDS